MLWWIPYVMVRIAAFFAAGILTSIYTPECISERVAIITLLFLLVIYFFTSRLPVAGDSRSLFSGLTGLTLIFLAGYSQLLNKTGIRREDHLSLTSHPIEYYTGILEAPEEKQNSIRAVIKIEEIRCQEKWTKASGKVLLYFTGITDSVAPEYGNRVIVQGNPSVTQGALNPGEFDFKKYLTQKNITHQQTVRRSEWRVVDVRTEVGLQFYSQQARKWASARIKKWMPGVRERAITMALVLGVAEGLDNDLQDAYSASGAMHVLSVSGLHVGIIYAIVLLLLKPIQMVSWGRWFTALLSLACLWAYAFVTGLSPSVLRAVMMFSFIVVGGPFGRNSSIYNTLAASAFLLLMWDPWLILSVGFQLSYLAVAGIVYLQRPLYELWKSRSWFWDKLWQITSVSIAAQLATFPLGLFYFHQFPVYFLISNLLVIPVSTAVLIAGIVLLLVSSFPVLAAGVSWIAQLLVKLLNGCVFFIEGLPGSVIDGVQISFYQCTILTIGIVTVVLLFQKRKLLYLAVTVMLALVFAILQVIHFRNNFRKDQMIVYYLRGHSAIERLQSGRCYFYSDTAVINDHRSIRFHVIPFRVLSGVSRTSNHPLSDSIALTRGIQVFRWNSRTVAYIGTPGNKWPESMDTDYLIVGFNALPSLHSVKGKIRFKQLILDGSNSRRYTDRLRGEARRDLVPVHVVRDDGAFIAQL